MRLLKSVCVVLLVLSSSITFGQPANRAFRDLQEEVDDLRQKIHCYELERDILEEKIHKQEASLTKLQKDLGQSQNSSQELSQNKISQLEKRLVALEQKNESLVSDLKQLQTHANTTTTSLTTFKTKMGDLEETMGSNVTHLKGAVESLVKVMQKGSPLDGTVEMNGKTKLYYVKPGDSLGSIAKAQGVKVDQIKRLNKLTKDRINIGQKLILEE